MFWSKYDGVKCGYHGYVQGTDISPSMLGIAHDREVEGDVCLSDLGHGVPFRMGTFDGAISISAVQWLPLFEEVKGLYCLVWLKMKDQKP